MTLTTVCAGRCPHIRRQSRRRWPGLSVLLIAQALVVATTLGAQEIELSDGSRTVDRHEIGNDLYVTISGVRPSTDYRLMLLDETQSKVAEVIRRSDPSGHVAAGTRPLWERTGILGCDLEAPINPGGYAYQDLDEADALLHGRTFTVEAQEVGSVQPVVIEQLPLTTQRTRPVFFFTDAAGCPRDEILEGESLYLYARGLDGRGQKIVLVLVEGGVAPEVGDPLQDVRSPDLGPQGIDVGYGQESFFELVWPQAQVGIYGAVARLSRDFTLMFRAEDRWVGRYGTGIPGFPGLVGGDSDISPHGITVVPWDCPGCNSTQ
ncbi:MAG: hypothetical protein AAGM22_28300 [Acidobacteriota bacterium]